MYIPEIKKAQYLLINLGRARKFRQENPDIDSYYLLYTAWVQV